MYCPANGSLLPFARLTGLRLTLLSASTGESAVHVNGLTWVSPFLIWLVVAGCASAPQRDPVDGSVVMARHLCQRGLYAIHNGQWDQAEAAFGRAVRACPEDSRARQQYADALWHRGATDRAIEEMKIALTLSGGDPEYVIQLGKMYLDRGKWAEALEQADRAVRSNRHRAEAWALRGDALRQRGALQEALDSYHRALNDAPKDERVSLAVAELYRQMNRPRGALMMLQRLAEKYPPGEEPARILQLQALAMQALGRNEDALRQLSLVRDRTGPTPELLHQLANLELAVGDLESARRDAAEAHRLGAGDGITAALMARIDARRPGGPAGAMR